MPDTYQYLTRPTTNGENVTTQASYRGTKTKAELIAEITARLGATPITIENILRTHHEVVLDWAAWGWKIEPFEGLIGFLGTCGGSTPLGEPENWNFSSMNLDLRGHWGEAGEARMAATFSAEKIGEQARVAPVYSEVYDSETRVPNHYVPGKGLLCKFSNKKFAFDTAAGCKARFQKADGTWVDAAGYPFVKGTTVVVTPPATLTGPVTLEVTALVNNALRSAAYPFPLT